MYPKSYFTYSIRLKVSWWSSSVSPGKPAIISWLSPQPGMMRRIRSMRAKYSSRLCPRFISLRMREDPLCTGKWMYLQMFGCAAMACSTSSFISCGLLVEKRMRMSGTACATRCKRSAKCTAVACAMALALAKSFLSPPPYHKYESTFWPRSVTSWYPSFHS